MMQSISRSDDGGVFPESAVGAKFDVSNKQRLGFSEVELVQKMIDGVSKVLELEEMLAGGASPADVRTKVDEMKSTAAGSGAC